MPQVRVKEGADLVVRHAGRRLRVTSEWAEVSDDALERLRAEGDERLEVRDPKQPAPKPAEADSGGKKFGRKASKDAQATKQSDKDEE